MASKLPDSDWSQRHTPISFRKLMALRRLHLDQGNSDVFESLSSGYPPGAISRTYGGHVFAQAAWAASKTVANGQYIHNITGHFLLLGDSALPFRYHVRRVRDGGIYALRQVDVYQDSDAGEHGKTPCFVAMVSLKRDESGKSAAARKPFRHQNAPRDHIEREYRVVLEGKRFEDHMIEQASDGIWSDALTFAQWRQRGDAFPGLEMRKVDMRAYNGVAVEGGADGGDVASRWRLLLFYRLIPDQDDAATTSTTATGGSTDTTTTTNNADEDEEDDLNLHACAHLYASDRNSLYLAQRALGFANVVAQMGSLAHTVHFHVSPKQLKMVDEVTGEPKMYVQESWTTNSGEDRACHESRLWDCSSGLILATTKQDGMVRVPKDGKKPYFDGDTPPRESKL